MIDQILGTTSILQKGLEGARKRHEAILQNIANIETPGYKRKIVHFEEDLRDALSGKGSISRGSRKSRLRAIANVHPRMDVDDESVIRADENTVDIDAESAEMAENTLRYLALLEILKRSFGGMKRAMAPIA
jgi:flagellar basal-body rod protein FlgB